MRRLTATAGTATGAAAAGDQGDEAPAAARGRPATGVAAGLVAGACFALLFIALIAVGGAG